MSSQRENVFVLPYAAREIRRREGAYEIIEHPAAHPKAYVLRRDLKHRDLLQSFLPFTYQTREWFVGAQRTGALNSIVPVPGFPAVHKHELVAVGNELVFDTTTEMEYYERLIELMEDPPFFADYIYEEQSTMLYPQVHPLREEIKRLFGIRIRPIGVRHLISFRRAKQRVLPPKNVTHFDIRKRHDSP